MLLTLNLSFKISGKILQKSLDIALFPGPILSGADVVQRGLDFFCCMTSSECGA